MNVVRIADLPWEELRSPAGKFHSFCRNVSLGLGGIRNAGTWVGGHPFDVQVRRIPAGAAVCPFHLHLAQWELFVVLSGHGTVRAGESTHAVSPGHVFVHPPNEPHQLTNSGASDLEVLIVADNPMLDAFYYPDSNKWGLRPPGKYFRMEEVGYFEGEEPAIIDAPPYRPSGSPPFPPLAAFEQRLRNLDTMSWDSWSSPRGKFRGESKELSIAMGAKRNTPIGLGGHPFEIELQRLGPGACGCPFHRHAAEWEMFYILNGSASIRTETTSVTIEAGEVVLHPPGEAHQLTNASVTTNLEFFVIADNAPVEYWEYPDTKKWGFRSPRKFFRASEVEYWADDD